MKLSTLYEDATIDEMFGVKTRKTKTKSPAIQKVFDQIGQLLNAKGYAGSRKRKILKQANNISDPAALMSIANSIQRGYI